MWYTWGRDKYKVLVGKPEEGRLVGGLGCGWDDDVGMDLGEAACGYVDWTHLIRDGVRWWTLAGVAGNR
jgi:hypothetical protein